ncbi:hypothetical protein JTE90_019262 [Oedothorax gibbosus]|uniref:Uncharacterized protein n=1 Tax=Oedothorax gibbosus TaxID=931172 RepID=A0AAV6UTD5_9ARAC|nr:hypothetical protein JTE90_019262 [Oedothorax gibbosus]
MTRRFHSFEASEDRGGYTGITVVRLLLINREALFLLVWTADDTQEGRGEVWADEFSSKESIFPNTERPTRAERRNHMPRGWTKKMSSLAS